MIVLQLVPSTAEAGTVAVGASGPPTYRAAAGETNSLTLTLRPASAAAGLDLTVNDSTAPIVAGPGCQQLSGDSVVCAQVGNSVNVNLGDGDDFAQLDLAGGQSSGTVTGGDGDDRLTVSGGGLVLNGGRGDDVVTGGIYKDSLNGGGGRDELHGGGGRDYVTDGDRDGAVDADVLDGGGRGCLDYSSRKESLRVDLTDPASDGEAGEADRVSGFTQVTTGRGDDVLAGTSAAEQLNGGGGGDRIYARGGDDLIATFGRELIVGGPGSDRVEYGGLPSFCGDARGGSSRLGSWLSRSCETLGITGESECGAAPVVRPQPVSVSRTGRMLFRLGRSASSLRPLACTLEPCRLTLTTAHSPFRRLAEGPIWAPGRGLALALRLPRGLSSRARHRPVRLRARLEWTDSCEARWSGAWRFDIRLPR